MCCHILLYKSDSDILGDSSCHLKLEVLFGGSLCSDQNHHNFLVHVAKHQVRSRVHLSVVRFHPILYQITLKHTSTGLPEKVLGYSTFSFCLGVGETYCFTALSHCFYCIGFAFEELSCCLFSCLFKTLFVKWNY